MSTFLYEFVKHLDDNWHEVDLLIQEATKIEKSNNSLYNALCRSITVLVVAHLEGFTKEVAKAVVRDFDSNCIFKDLPPALQRTYCKKYIGLNIDNRDKSYEKKISSLISKFIDVESRISVEPFLLSTNKNPNPSTIETIFQNFGVSNVFAHLHESELDRVFSEPNKRIKDYINEQKLHILKASSSFPYSCSLSRIDLEKSLGKIPRRTLWEEFLDQVNKKRHRVAHGNAFDNLDGVSLLEERKDKIVYLQLGLIELLAGSLSKQIKNVSITKA